MIFCHIVDDYYLQGILASMKQRKWWKENAPEKLYKHDYIAALFMHSFSWAFVVMLIPAYYALTSKYASGDGFEIISSQIIVAFIINLVIHAVTDHAKANLHKINLIQDQLIHMMQIISIWLYLVVIR